MKPLDNQKLIGLLRHYFSDYSHDWNYYHSLAAARRMRQLVGPRDSVRVLVTAAYLHDIGYSQLLSKKYTLTERLANKKAHMRRGAAIARRELPRLGYHQDEVRRISHLIGIHDTLKKLRTRDELLLLEADSISQLDPNSAVSGFSKKDMRDYLRKFSEKRLPRFITVRGRRIVKPLFIKHCRKFGVDIISESI